VSRLARARLPPGVRIYSVGDVHGRADLLRPLLRQIHADITLRRTERTITVFLGDYIDRGPQSREVIDALIEFSLTHETVFLKGNHEAFLLRFLLDPLTLAEWQQFGGIDTLNSYRIQTSLGSQRMQNGHVASRLRRMLPISHRKFLKRLQLYFSCGDFFFVHAGVRPGVSLDQQKEADLLWIRHEFLDSAQHFGKLVVHGHTPVLEPEVRFNRINIDTGAFATGRLSCLVLEEDALSFLTTT
jgi:serine/threonine protein phosphatase 1